MENTKKTSTGTVIAIFGSIIVVAATAAYFLFFKKPNVSDEPNPDGGNEPNPKPNPGGNNPPVDETIPPEPTNISYYKLVARINNSYYKLVARINNVSLRKYPSSVGKITFIMKKDDLIGYTGSNDYNKALPASYIKLHSIPVAGGGGVIKGYVKKSDTKILSEVKNPAVGRDFTGVSDKGRFAKALGSASSGRFAPALGEITGILKRE